MEINYKITGKKGARKVVKEVGISEDSYLAFKRLLECGPQNVEGTVFSSLQEVYGILGGNCYGSFISVAVDLAVSLIVRNLDERGFLSVGRMEARQKISGIIMPLMCYTDNDELRFINTDAKEIIAVVRDCLVEDKANVFEKELSSAMETDERPAGEVATCKLMYLAIDEENEG